MIRMRPLRDRLQEDMMSALVVSLCLSEDQSDSILVGVRGRVKPRVEREDVIGGELGIGGKERGERGKREDLCKLIKPPETVRYMGKMSLRRR